MQDYEEAARKLRDLDSDSAESIGYLIKKAMVTAQTVCRVKDKLFEPDPGHWTSQMLLVAHVLRGTRP